jgi:enoyl-CoA hydratase/carnithine racemase
VRHFTFGPPHRKNLSCSLPLLSGVDFIRPEYQLDFDIARLNLKKPFISLWNGFVMGGGVGLSHASTFIVVTEKTVFAMPETKIGFIPDVAASYFLNRLPGFIGTAMALTGERLLSSDLISAGLATHYAPSHEVGEIILALTSVNVAPGDAGTVREALDGLLVRLTERFDSGGQPMSDILRRRKQIDRIFEPNSLTSILKSLDKEAATDPYLKSLADRIRSYGPTAMSVTLRMMRKMQPLVAKCGARADFLDAHKTALEMEYRIMLRMLKRHDTKEGVICLLVEKGRKPKFDPPTVEGVSEELIESFFKPLNDSDHPQGELRLTT